MAAYARSSTTQQQAYSAPHGAPAAPPGTFAPGTKVQCGSHRVVIEKYLSEGGFAHVYVVQYSAAGGGTETAVLKRVAVPDKDALANMRTEVETMKKLQGHKHIVTYIDSHASQLKGGGYEVFLLMEYCQGGGLIDFMNTRLKNRLTEPEILHIFSDAAEGLACMHYLKPPLLHRDLKIENILISSGKKGERLYKLCDFGSSAPPRPAATSAAEGRLIEDDVQRHTTLQYRSPEMVDVYRNRPIDEKSDIWALGVMLYKLCYYTTPFEDQGQMAILTASFKYPPYPPFSDRLKLLIAQMLTEEPRKRPNIYQVLCEVCSMRNKPVPIKDIYSQRTASEARSNQELPPAEPDVKSPPLVGASYAAPETAQQTIPDITPMRRGRPTSTQTKTASKPSPSPAKPVSADPFAALDSQNFKVRAAAVDQLSSKYPAIEDFSLLQNKDTKFKFDSSSPPATTPTTTDKAASLSARVTNALADEAFGSRASARDARASVGNEVARAASMKERAPPKPPRPQQAPQPIPSVKTLPQPTSKPLPRQPLEEEQPPPKPKRTGMISTGTMTQDDLPPKPAKPLDLRERPTIWKVPVSKSRSPRLSVMDSKGASPPEAETSLLVEALTGGHESVSSRPSLEGAHRPMLNVLDPSPRSASVSRRHEMKRPGSSQLLNFGRQRTPDPPQAKSYEDDVPIESNVDFLKAMEEQNANKLNRNTVSATKQGHFKTSSVSSVGKGLFGGRLGDAFKRFEGGRSPNTEAASQRRSEYFGAVEAPLSLDDKASEIAVEDSEDLSPEMRRELERRRLSQEEKRVAQAAAAWRQQNTGGGSAPGRSAKASAIQDRVKSLLDESNRQAPVKRQAEGYGQYTRAAEEREMPVRESSVASRAAPPVAVQKKNEAPPMHANETGAASSAPQVGPGPRNSSTGVPSRPNAPPKPVSLRTGGTPVSASPAVGGDEAATGATALDDDWESTFAKKYPRISLDLVETDIVKGSGGGRAQRVKDA